MVVIKNQNYEVHINEVGACIDALLFNGVNIAHKGITVGRYANRIAKGKFTLNGKEYQLAINDRSNHLHGGPNGFSHKTWTVVHQEDEMAVFSLLSPDGDENYPGKLYIEVEFQLLSDGLAIEYTVKTEEDTIGNFTNHAYFNLNGALDEKLSKELSEDEKKALGMHEFKLMADKITEVDDELIPTGKILDVAGTMYDFRNQKTYDVNLDTNFCLNAYDEKNPQLSTAAVLKGKKSNITVEVLTDQPGIQIYNTETEICLETQHWPDSPNHPSFPTAVIKAGEIFNTKTIYKITK